MAAVENVHIHVSYAVPSLWLVRRSPGCASSDALFLSSVKTALFDRGWAAERSCVDFLEGALYKTVVIRIRMHVTLSPPCPCEKHVLGLHVRAYTSRAHFNDFVKFCFEFEYIFV